MEIQILLAFVIQSLIAVFVSAYTFLLSFVIQRRWDAAATEPEAWTFFVQDNAPAWLRMLKNPRSAIDLLTFKLLRLSFWWMPSLNLAKRKWEISLVDAGLADRQAARGTTTAHDRVEHRRRDYAYD
jgi:hypothetical protein